MQLSHQKVLNSLLVVLCTLFVIDLSVGFPDVLSITALISKLNMSNPDLLGNSKTAPKNTNKLWSKISFVGFAK